MPVTLPIEPGADSGSHQASVFSGCCSSAASGLCMFRSRPTATPSNIHPGHAFQRTMAPSSTPRHDAQSSERRPRPELAFVINPAVVLCVSCSCYYCLPRLALYILHQPFVTPRLGPFVHCSRYAQQQHQSAHISGTNTQRSRYIYHDSHTGRQ